MPRTEALRWLLVAGVCCLAAGCDDSDTQTRVGPKPTASSEPTDSIRKHVKPVDPSKVVAVKPTDSGGGGKPIPAAVESAPYPNPPTETRPAAVDIASEPRPENDNARALFAISSEIAETLKIRPTLVVWLIDKSAPSASVRGGMALGIPQASQRAIAKSKGKHPLSTAIVTYGDGVTMVTAEPVADTTQVSNLLSGIGEDKTESPVTFAAVNKAADQFLPYRAKGFAVLFVIAANQAGKDWSEYDQAVPKLREKAAQVFGMGQAISFGRPANVEPDKIPSESAALERIGLQYPPPNSDVMAENDLTDSGYGPYGLERLCHDTKGQFFRIRMPEQSPGWTTDASGDIDPALQKKYAPDYVSEKKYQELLNENKARMALHNAAMVPFTGVLRSDKKNLTTYFTRPKNEAQLANMITNAQRPAAEKSLDVDKLYDVLSKGESERSKLTGARWQVEFDLAMGRMLAAKARIDGYNSLLASIKQGKAFKDPKSSAFVLTRAETITSSSVLNKMATNSIMYLNRVLKEHPGTPWAVLAERELSSELPGWEMSEQ